MSITLKSKDDKTNFRGCKKARFFAYAQNDRSHDETALYSVIPSSARNLKPKKLTKSFQKLISVFSAFAIAAGTPLPVAIAHAQSAESAVTFDDGTLSQLSDDFNWHLDERYIYNSSQTVRTVSVADVGEPHGYAMKILHHGNYPIPITHSVSADGSSPVIVEFSYKEDGFGQPRVWLTGKTADGSSKTIEVIESTNSYTWQFKFCHGETHTMPRAEQWRRVRLVFDLQSGDVTLAHWAEASPYDVTEVVASGALSALSSIDTVQLRPYTRTEDGNAIYIDDIHIYEKTNFAIEGFSIADGAHGIWADVTPELRFNMPLAPIESQNLSLTVDGYDTQGKKLSASDYSIVPSRLGSAVALESLKRFQPYKPCRISISGVAQDLWGREIAVDETLTFTPGALSTGATQIADCVFTLNGQIINYIDYISSGTLGANITLAPDGGKNEDFLVALSVYDEDGALIAIDIKSVNSPLATFALSAQVPNDGKDYSARLYAWNSAVNPTPHRASITGGTNMKQSYITARATDISQVITVTDEQVKQRMKDVILMTPTSSKALVKNMVTDINQQGNLTPEIHSGIAFVPVVFTAKELGFSAELSDSAVAISANGKVSSAKAGATQYIALGKEQTAPFAPYEKNGDLMVSIDAIANMLGTQAIYDDGGYIIVGKDAESFNLANKTDKKILDKAIAPVIFHTPTADEVVAMLKTTSALKAHPRLMVTADTIEALKDKIANDPDAAEWYKAFLANCNENYLNADMLEYQLKGVRLLEVSRKVLEHVSNLSFAYLIEGDEKYAAKAIEQVMNVCSSNFPDWNQKHFLDVAEMAAAVAIGYDWCNDKLSTAQKTAICDALSQKAFKYGLMQLRGEEFPTTSGFWTDQTQATYPGNWVSVCSGGLSMAALAVGDESPELEAVAGEIVSGCVPHLQRLVAKFAPDGSWKEGPTYWSYAYKYLTFNFASMFSALGTDFGLSKAPGLHKGAYFMIAMTGSVANFDLANSDPRALSCPQFMWLGARYEDPSLTRYRKWFIKNFGVRPDFTDILWYTPSHDGDISAIATETNTREFPIAATRSGYGTDQFYVAFHGADDGGGRIVDLDCGQYIIDLFGTRWIKDMGSEGEMYGSHGDEGIFLNDYPYYRMRAEAHNTIVVNPGYYEDQNYSVLKDVDTFCYNNRYTLMSSDFTDAYAFKGVQLFERSILADKVSMSTIIQDKVRMAVPSDFYSFIHVGGDIELSSDGKSAIISKGSNKMLVKLLGSDDFTFAAMPCVPLDGSPHVKYGADDSASRKLYIKADHITEADYAICITPLCGNETDAVADVLADITGFAIAECEAVPTASAITVGGAPIEGFSPDKRIYTLSYVDYVKGLADISEVSIDAAGADGAHVSVEQPVEDNRCARITVTNGNSTGYYFINFEY